MRRMASFGPMRRRRKHARGLLRWPAMSGRLLVVVGIGFFVIGSTAFAAYAYDSANAERVLPGVSVEGVDVGGMTREEAVDAVGAVADRLLSEEIEIVAGEQSWSITPAELRATADVEAKVDEALAVSERYSWPVRAFRRLFGQEVEERLPLEISPHQARTERFVDTIEEAVSVSPRDAVIELADEQLKVRRPREGVKLRAGRAVRDITRSIASPGGDVVDLRVKTVPPLVTGEDLGQTIAVRISENRLYLYDGLDLVKTYPVATGLGGYPTPRGEWKIINKVANPTWVNPAPNGWGKDLPRTIGPGPGNPLGTHALYLNAPGIRIHGTYASYSIGTYASHGCIRMYISDSQELFDIVEIDTPVLIYY